MTKAALVFVSLLAGLALISAACGDDSSIDIGADGNSLGGPWILVDSLVDGAPLALLPDYAVTMNIKDGQLGGRAACNSYGGSLTVTDTDFRSSEVFQTEMGCEEPAMSLEFADLSALTRLGFRSMSRDGSPAQPDVAPSLANSLRPAAPSRSPTSPWKATVAPISRARTTP
jgi:heat shock protein HslJ